MKKQYQEPVIEVVAFEMDEAIAAKTDVISGFENDIPIDGDLID